MHILYITAPSKEEALNLAGSLISKKLAACCNIIEGVTSVYEWEGEVKQESECIIIAKTSSKTVEKAIEHAKSIHPYNCPCVVSIKSDKANQEFINWVEKSTTPS